MKTNSFLRGVNLGGWLSQCENRRGHAHYGTFITKADIKRIAGWGMDHVRLPIDVSEFAKPDDTLNEEVMPYIDRALDWCFSCGLNVQLDMHKAPGHDLANGDCNPLYFDDALQARFFTLWQRIARRYLHCGNELRFELLNEPTTRNSYAVSRLMHRAIQSVRQVDSQRVIVACGSRYDHVDHLSKVLVDDDPNVLYTFHFYEPEMFTNQGWAQAHGLPHPGYEGKLHYPGELDGLAEHVRTHPESADTWGRYLGRKNDLANLQDYFAQAADFMQWTGKRLYLGEFGITCYADESDRCKWVGDVIRLAEAHGIGWCYWNYKEMDYGLVDIHGHVIHPALMEVVKRA